MDAFGRYLLGERGLALGHRVHNYVDGARQFVAGREASELRVVTPGEVTAAVVAKSTAVSVSTTQNYVASLRAFLRFCFIEGLVDHDISQAALAITGRRRSLLPRGIAKHDADALLASCDRRTAIGRRDYTLIIMLLRLGLRRGEVAALRLDDIDWRAGELVVVGKGARRDRLPLPADVGAAIAAYLRHGRPASDHRQVFLRARAPFEPMACRHRCLDGAARLPAGGCARGGRAPAPPHRCLRHGGSTGPAAPDRPGAPSPEPAVDRDLRPRRSRPAPPTGSALARGRHPMSALADHVEDYLRLRRALGYKLERAGHLLPQLVAYLEQAGSQTLTTDLAIAWARLPADARPNYWAARLTIVRGFARYLQTIEPATEVPPAAVFPTRRHRPAPYLWSEQDIARLLDGARALRPALRAATCESLFGLLAVSGMRVGEAVGLDRSDVNFDTGVITIRHAKFDRPRLVPLHATTTAALRAYAIRTRPPLPRHDDRRRSSSPSPAPGSTAARWPRCSGRSPRPWGCAAKRCVPPHTNYATASRCAPSSTGSAAGVRVEEHIAVLSTYLGHVSPADTYWYLSASPELMALAAERLDTRYGARR